jgi:hypothetical protein
MDALPKMQPIVGGLKNVRGRPSDMTSQLAMLFEARVGAGRLLFSGLNIVDRLDEGYPEAVYMLDRLLRYATSTAFEPAAAMTRDQFYRMVVPYTRLVR